MSDEALAFIIDAPLQSWGTSSRFQRRETAAFPTKSGVIGILAAALGIDKQDPDEAAKLHALAGLRLTVVAIPRSGSVATTRLEDFHTIGGGYDKRKPVERLSIPQKATGAPFGTVITRRAYLTDARFIAVLEGKPKTLNRCAAALRDPVWGVWFGRKSCVPATPLTPTRSPNLQVAVDTLLPYLGHEAAPLDTLEHQKESHTPGTGEQVFHQPDQPVAFGQHHGAVPAPYRTRPVIHHRPNFGPE